MSPGTRGHFGSATDITVSTYLPSSYTHTHTINFEKFVLRKVMYSLLFSSNKLHLCTHVIANFSVFRVITHKELAPGIVTRISHNFEEAASGHYAPVSCLKINLLSQMLVINQGIK